MSLLREWLDRLNAGLRHGRQRVSLAVARERSWLARVAATALLIAIGLVATAILLLVVLLALPLFLVALLVGSAQRSIARAQNRAGIAEGRRNVRVVVRDPAP